MSYCLLILSQSNGLYSSLKNRFLSTHLSLMFLKSHYLAVMFQLYGLNFLASSPELTQYVLGMLLLYFLLYCLQMQRNIKLVEQKKIHRNKVVVLMSSVLPFPIFFHSLSKCVNSQSNQPVLHSGTNFLCGPE